MPVITSYSIHYTKLYDDIRINLAHKGERAMQSHPITLRLRNELTEIAAANGALLKIVESPPGPPVIATLTAEVYAEPGISS